MYNEPLAFRMQPKKIEDIVGHQNIIGPTSRIYKMIQKNYVPSMIFYGPPGTGKTSIATAIAGSIDLPFYTLNATESGVKDIENIIKEADFLQKVVLFVDEIHSFNKSQQDKLLPYVANGKIILIGATTENPFHNVNPAIRSRCNEIIQLENLTIQDLTLCLKKALTDKVNGLGNQHILIKDEFLERIAVLGGGDVRKTYNILESLVYSGDETTEGIVVTDDMLVAMEKSYATYSDNKGSHFYNLLSALQKSVRGSDVDASLYYLAHLLESGDLIATCRRILVMAFEDISNANNECATNVKASVDSALMLGMPEARIPLAKAIVEMCLSEKSNSAYKSLDRAIELARKESVAKIPMHLRDAHFKGAKTLGHTGYKYPHDTPLGEFGGWVKQQYLPDEHKDKEFYIPTNAGNEKRMAAIHHKLKKQ